MTVCNTLPCLVLYDESLLLSGLLCAGSGVKQRASTALGMTDTILGCSEARSTVFSLLCVCVGVCVCVCMYGCGCVCVCVCGCVCGGGGVWVRGDRISHISI